MNIKIVTSERHIHDSNYAPWGFDIIILLDEENQKFKIKKNRFGKVPDEFISVSLLSDFLRKPNGSLTFIPKWE